MRQQSETTATFAESLQGKKLIIAMTDGQQLHTFVTCCFPAAALPNCASCLQVGSANLCKAFGIAGEPSKIL